MDETTTGGAVAPCDHEWDTREVLVLHRGGPIAVDILAAWCATCGRLTDYCEAAAA